jgi:hypothetical protein
VIQRFLVLSALLFAAAACPYNGRDAGGPDAPPGTADAPLGTPDGTPVPDAPPGTPDAANPVDTDGDGVADTTDNCPTIANATQANEDGDDRGNACDRCPHRAGSVPGGDADADGDGIGDQCDPRSGADRLVLFLGFDAAADFADFEVREGAGSWTVSGGALHLSTTTSGQPQQVVWTGEQIMGTVDIDTNVTVDDVPAPGNPGTRLAAVVGAYWEQTTPVDAYACGLRATSSAGALQVAAWHYVNPPTADLVQTAAFTGNMGVGATGRVHLLATDNSTDSVLDCTANTTPVSLPVPGYVPAGMPGFRTLGTSVTFDYLFVVEVGP